MQPEVTVGILSARQVSFEFSGIYSTRDITIVTGRHTACISPTGLALDWDGRSYTTITFTPTSANGDSFSIDGVTIGVGFHWQRQENQRFRGSLILTVNEGKIQVINSVAIEEYLTSVISSEMNSQSPMHLLRAHAVISRSWVMAQIEAREKSALKKTDVLSVKNGEIMRWWDHEDHKLFNICADDHCQRYQGLGRVNRAAAGAVSDTRGLVLTAVTPDGKRKLCDARFSKCCGGMTEVFSSCWEDSDEHPYLQGRRDDLLSESTPDLRIESNSGRWIASRPEAFCSEVSEDTLARVLNGYDRLFDDYYRWSVTLSQEEICSLLSSRADINVGKVINLQAIERGTSGRIVRLHILGTKGQVTIGKELMIRRALSPSHLLSSAFTVSRQFSSDDSGIPSSFTLHGAGWGHGVGLCQIGAAVMAERGYDFRAILSHYYPGSQLTNIYG